MGGHAQGDAGEAGAGEVADRAGRREAGTTSVSGPGQNASARRRRAVVEHALAPRRREVRHMRDQRVEARPPLGGVDPGDRARVGRVGAEAVDRLGREGDEAAVAQQARRLGDIRLAASAASRRVADVGGPIGD